MALGEIKDIKLEQEHYLFNYGRMGLGETKRIYKGLKKVICDR